MNKVMVLISIAGGAVVCASLLFTLMCVFFYRIERRTAARTAGRPGGGMEAGA
jgi:hypothetical protein